MNSGNRQSAIGNCQSCDGTGWRPRDPAEPRRGVVRCTHGAGRLERIGPAVHRLIGSLEKAALTPHDGAIRDIILRHVGRANAIRGRDLAVKVWPDEMANPAKYESAVRRWLEESIYRLRRFAHLPIAASKSNPMGYYLPASDAEGRECHDRLIREAVERLRDSQLFKRDADLMQELRGQLKIENCQFDNSLRGPETQ